ncbi:MAG: response regulator transcription factor [Proteobacteria bacterium]|uniref:response regulator transcription factor n=1 Tax=Rudaea sp. TaxID=2136325 RepID=UPI001D815D10|nr:response regulator transcription factor [Pseudomonadota bacterium]MBS0567711.1 response regulator transcription factor [Pseudomonadota bacterium]
MTSAPSEPKRVLLIDDDEVFTRVLARALAARGFAVAIAHDAAQARARVRAEPPQFAVLDLKLGADNGLALIPELKALRPDLRILLLTGYASIATAVEAIKRGADDYLAKPVDADAIVHALLETQHAGAASDEVALPHAPPPLKRLEWEHIQRVLTECEGNISETARRLGLHRRTLQRKLAKRPVREAD